MHLQPQGLAALTVISSLRLNMAKAELAIKKGGLVCPRACNTTCQIKPSRLNLTKATTSHILGTMRLRPRPVTSFCSGGDSGLRIGQVAWRPRCAWRSLLLGGPLRARPEGTTDLRMYWVLCTGAHPDLRKYWVSGIVLWRVGLGSSLGLAGLQICKCIGFCAQDDIQICENIWFRPMSCGGSA